MEYRQVYSLSNAEIINILEERQLKIPNIEKLNRSELVTIFNKFAVPLCKRNTTHKNYKPSSSPESPEKMDYSLSNEHILKDDDKITRKRNQSIIVDDTVTKMSRITLKLNVNGNTLKREYPSEQILLLNTPSKRKKITWP